MGFLDGALTVFIIFIVSLIFAFIMTVLISSFEKDEKSKPGTTFMGGTFLVVFSFLIWVMFFM